MVERAGVIQASQRARGLDTEGSLWARVRGVVPLAGPVILSSLTEVEERSLALEVRAFGRPGRRHLLWRNPDSAAQLVARAGAAAPPHRVDRRQADRRVPAHALSHVSGGRCSS